MEEEPSYFIYLATYYSYIFLILVGHMRDFMGKRFHSKQYEHLKAHDVRSSLDLTTNEKLKFYYAFVYSRVTRHLLPTLIPFSRAVSSNVSTTSVTFSLQQFLRSFFNNSVSRDPSPPSPRVLPPFSIVMDQRRDTLRLTFLVKRLKRSTSLRTTTSDSLNPVVDAPMLPRRPCATTE